MKTQQPPNRSNIKQAVSTLSSNDQVWIAPVSERIPDFIICGAMKSGTSTVHELLGKHPRVFIPHNEINFFDMDDIFQHSDFIFYDDDKWVAPRIQDNPKIYWKWYLNHFKEAPEDSIIGEDSTTYISSANAAHRIALQQTAVKP